jgi:hypothetical protein
LIIKKRRAREQERERAREQESKRARARERESERARERERELDRDSELIVCGQSRGSVPRLWTDNRRKREGRAVVSLTVSQSEQRD